MVDLNKTTGDKTPQQSGRRRLADATKRSDFYDGARMPGQQAES